jgi:PhnB protein
MTMRPAVTRMLSFPIYIEGASEAVGFYARAFGAEEIFRIAAPNGRMSTGSFGFAMRL